MKVCNSTEKKRNDDESTEFVSNLGMHKIKAILGRGKRGLDVSKNTLLD